MIPSRLFMPGMVSGRVLGLWQTWCMHRTENPAKMVRVHWGPQTGIVAELVDAISRMGREAKLSVILHLKRKGASHAGSNPAYTSNAVRFGSVIKIW